MSLTKHNQPVVFVTGGSRGIGKALVEKFQAEGWKVAACAVHAKESGADLHLVCDVGDVEQVRVAIQSIMNTFGRLDAVINNAGATGTNSLDPKENDDLWHRAININLNGTYYVSKYALPYLPNNKGRIVNISSVLGLKGVPGATAYCAAKHGVVGFTKALAHDTAPRRITVNAICPGWVRTDMALNRMKEIGLSEEQLAASVPLGRFIEPDEVAELAYYLVASDASAGITGQTFTIDGGALA
jgi:NAD(P)-dependent dehydrogenase (short-subunit alcohol dehydrogenase family)